jgi:hypothetical protein
MAPLDLSDAERAALVALLRHTFDRDPYPRSPRPRPLSALAAAAAPAGDPGEARTATGRAPGCQRAQHGGGPAAATKAAMR